MKKQYRCSSCGKIFLNWFGQCDSCGAWGTAEEVFVEKKNKQSAGSAPTGNQAVALKNIPFNEESRIISGIEEMNRVLGGGLVKDSVSVLTAPPGVGKSTLLLSFGEDLARKGYRILYASGEESEGQIKSRALRIMKDLPEHVWILSTAFLDDVLGAIDSIQPHLVVLDSIQTFRLREFAQRAGTPVQTMECANRLTDLAKSKERPFAVMMVGHMTKSGEMAGLRTLEHLVDTVLFLEEGEGGESLRILLSTKNRFGRTGEIGLFEMAEEGMKEIKDPSKYFVTKRKEPVAGSALAMIKEGSRFLVIEVESLVSQSFTPYPQRLGDSLRKDQLNTLVSILEERAKLSLYDKNVILKTTGGIRLAEQSVNLAVLMSIVSSLKHQGIEESTLFVAEVGLTGELKIVPNLDFRLREIERLGYQKVYTAPFFWKKDFSGLQVIQKETLSQVIGDVFNH